VHRRKRSIFLLANDLVVAWSAHDRCSVAVFCKQVPPAFQAIGDQDTACDSSLNGTPRFMGMGAIAKAAKRRQSGLSERVCLYRRQHHSRKAFLFPVYR
jgi:hypothetical protein